jgi:hypothetical protein
MPAATARTARRYRHSEPEVERSRTAREVLWEQREESVANTRSTYGVEHCVADYETLCDAIGAQCTVTQNQYDYHFAKWWAQYKPHVILKNMPEWAQKKIAAIELNGAPSWNEPLLGSHDRDEL